MAVCVVQHVSFEGPGLITPILEERGFLVQTVHLWRGEPLPPPEEVQMLVSMGGPMSVHDSREYRWLLNERELIADLHRRGTPVLGVCLGAQQIAAALGGTVVPSPEREIGWFPVSPPLTAAPAAAPAPANTEGTPEAQRMTVLHWHGEMVDLGEVPEALVTLTSAGCPVQAFRCGAGTVGLQFHLEMDEAAVRRIIDHSTDELDQHAGERYVQSAQEILEGISTGTPSTQQDRITVLAALLTELTSSII